MNGAVIVVVDDDDLVRRATCRVLTGLGYGVVEAVGGASCREALRARQDVACVVVDLGLPDGPGEVLADDVRGLRPGVPVIFMTGRRDDLPARGSPLLQKPFTAAALKRALDAVIGPRQGAG